MWRIAYHHKDGLKHEIFNGRAQTDAFLDDYALLGLGFLALHDASADITSLQRAGQLADDLLARFQRADGSLATTTAEKDLPMPPPEDGDSVYPTGSSAAVDLLLRLERSTGATRYGDAARALIERLGRRLEDSPESWPGLLVALAENDFAPAPLATEAVVRASAVLKARADRDEIVVTLQIADGYHINANPATYNYLIATSVTFDGITPAQVLYPQASLFRPAFAPEGLKVYEGKVMVQAWFSKGTVATDAKISVSIAAQACNSEICLPPAKLPVAVVRDGPH
jgi:hypothetical protein